MRVIHLSSLVLTFTTLATSLPLSILDNEYPSYHEMLLLPRKGGSHGSAVADAGGSLVAASGEGKVLLKGGMWVVAIVIGTTALGNMA